MKAYGLKKDYQEEKIQILESENSSFLVVTPNKGKVLWCDKFLLMRKIECRNDEILLHDDDCPFSSEQKVLLHSFMNDNTAYSTECTSFERDHIEQISIRINQSSNVMKTIHRQNCNTCHNMVLQNQQSTATTIVFKFAT